ncbi:MAG: amino acid permease [Pseudomonadales bacterium]|jgi:APA family basic amino acid/polyamine antiporter|nr:amino acid permease [Pseudomonadales bacterium]MDP7597676.1 amino acid permease [Pseudomonadales bacterium]HJN50638.1 amino acid permease [Pseudomonadales bacterium]|tara:strand:- start:6029 stop:7324 length:1296 start_codon:yes stop_codon:yes gene_type:complete
MSSFKPSTAMAVVIASMVGTGVFTSLGFQLVDIQSGFPLMMLWAIGGMTALCGALTYAELGSALPRSGGEYNFLTEIYHPAAGFVSGWISATVGFAAPTALAAITFGTYLAAVFPFVNPKFAACILVMILTTVHCTTHRNSGELQLVFSILKVIAIVAFCGLALALVEEPQPVRFLPQPGDGELMIGGAFAVSLIFVNYAYTGWNAATYLTNELHEPQRNLPLILTGGTLIVLVLYLMLNFTFLYVAPMTAMTGKVEIGYIAAGYAFGSSGAKIMGVILAALLISTVSAMIMAGPRVLQVIGEDFAAFRFFAGKNADGIPVMAIAIQSLVTLVFILTAAFESILVFSGFTLGINTLFAVAGIYVLRWRQPKRKRPYRTLFYPVTPLIYLLITTWTIVYILIQRPEEGLLGLGLIAFGGVFYFFSAKLSQNM